MKKIKSVRIDEKLYNQVKEMGEMAGFTTTSFLNCLLRQGVISVKKNGIQPTETEQKPIKTDKEFLLSEGEKMAKKGLDELNTWYISLSNKEKNDVKYSIKGWREIAKKTERGVK